MAGRYFAYRHIVGFEETNLVGNVYYVNHLRWQGRCREMFLRERAPGTLRRLETDLALATVRCSCEYFAELAAFDEIEIRMTLQDLVQNRISMRFEYWKIGEADRLVAAGEQQNAVMRRTANGLEAAEIPQELRNALLS